MNGNNTKQLFFILVLLVAFSFPYLWSQINITTGILKKAQIHSKEKVDPFSGLDIEAKAAYVFDLVTGLPLYAYNENENLPLASLTKVMTAIVATDLVPKSSVVSITKDDVKLEGDSGLLVGEKWRLSDIIDFTLTTSSNDGASAIASVAGSIGQNAYGVSPEQAKNDFVNKMNLKTQELGLSNTYFFNETGLDVGDSVVGSYGTAKDMAILMGYAIKNKSRVIEATSREGFKVSSLDNISHSAINTNKSVDNIPGLIASKTGFTDLAGGNLVVAFDAGMMHPVVVSVLGSSIDGRFKDVEKLVWASLESL